MVKSNTLFNPQSYLMLVTDICYFQKSSEDVYEFIDNVLQHHGLELWNYPLKEIDHIIENDIDVVLVDCSHFEDDCYINELRWFEVPSDIVADDEELNEACELGGDISNDCADCAYSCDYHWVDGHCVLRD